MKIIKLSSLLLILLLFSSCVVENNVTQPTNQNSTFTTSTYDIPNVQNNHKQIQIATYFSQNIKNSKLNKIYLPNILLENMDLDNFKCQNIGTIVHCYYNNSINSSSDKISYSNIELQIDFLEDDFDKLIDEFASEVSLETSYFKYISDDVTMHLFYNNLNEGLGLHGIYKINNTDSYCYFQCIVDKTYYMDDNIAQTVHKDFSPVEIDLEELK